MQLHTCSCRLTLSTPSKREKMHDGTIWRVCEKVQQHGYRDIGKYIARHCKKWLPNKLQTTNITLMQFSTHYTHSATYNYTCTSQLLDMHKQLIGYTVVKGQNGAWLSLKIIIRCPFSAPLSVLTFRYSWGVEGLATVVTNMIISHWFVCTYIVNCVQTHPWCTTPAKYSNR